AIKAGVPDFLRRGDIELGKELVVDMSDLDGLPAGTIHQKKVADIDRSGDKRHKLGSIPGSAEPLHRLIAPGNLCWFSGSNIKLHQVGFAFPGSCYDQTVAIRRPDHLI